MKELCLNDLLDLIELYNPEGKEKVKKAYEYAERLHEGQMRQSGEPYISHPLNVAYILAEMHGDTDTICAGLLHDTLEDTIIKKEDIAHDFNQEVANLVDGVTKISKLNFSTKQDQNMANTRKIITGITEDVRIIIIKLAERCHNMRTLWAIPKEKQRLKAKETLEILAPIAHRLGLSYIKAELEELSLKYYKPEAFDQIEEELNSTKEERDKSSNSDLILYATI